MRQEYNAAYAADMCCPRGIILPFVLLVAWLGQVMEDVIREVAP